MADGAKIEVVNVEGVMRALRVAPIETEKSIRGVLVRGGSGFRKRSIKNRMSGPPGIKLDQSKRKIGSNIRYKVAGDRLDEMSLTIKLSRFLMSHEEGRTLPQDGDKGYLAIRLKPGLPIKPDRKGLFFLHTPEGGLFLAKKEDGKTELMYMLRKKVQMKPRLGIRAEWGRFEPTLIRRINRAVERSMERTFEKNVKGISGAVSGLGGE